MTLQLIPVTGENWREIINLSIRPDQARFVATNAISLLQAHYQPDLYALPYGIYADDTLIGFVMTFHLDKEGDPATIWIMRFMIGSQHQGKGFGKAALLYVLDFLKRSGAYDKVRLSYVPDNEVAKNLYLSLGFVEEGLNPEWGEVVARYELHP
jgi:diamine N-acetyltransferase